ncbi:MAG: CotH kinase family protein [Aureispira sp.]|nr:CotH kinase family protein [Aureispira sp.]
MSSSNFLLPFLVLILFTGSCYKEQVIFAPNPNEELELPLILAFNKKDCFFDEESRSFSFSIPEDSVLNYAPFVQFQDYSTILIDGRPLSNNAINNLGTVKTKKVYTLDITTQGNTEYFTLRFTTLPIVRVVCRSNILNDPKLIARLTINLPINNTDVVSSFVGIDFRGASSILNPKKSYGFTFLDGIDMGNKVSKGLFGWKKNEDWILDAVYNDVAKFRNKLSFEIWEAMNPTEHVSIQSKFVELYLNNSFQGLYCLTEQMNPEKLGLLDSAAILYKTVEWDPSTIFESLSVSEAPAYTDLWEGWELKYPNSSSPIKWQPLYALRNWVVNESDQEFIDNVSTHLNLDNIVEYYLFINLIGAFDNHGKNMFWLKPSNAPFFIVPWDLDTSWGRGGDRASLLPVQVVITYNKLFHRLLELNPDNFKSKLQNKWNNLRSNAWTNNNIETLLDEKFEELMRTNVIELDNARWGETVDLDQERIYIHSWMNDQFNLLDAYFNNL